jgi:hypothetical protein
VDREAGVMPGEEAVRPFAVSLCSGARL